MDTKNFNVRRFAQRRATNLHNDFLPFSGGGALFYLPWDQADALIATNLHFPNFSIRSFFKKKSSRVLYVYWGVSSSDPRVQIAHSSEPDSVLYV